MVSQGSFASSRLPRSIRFCAALLILTVAGATRAETSLSDAQSPPPTPTTQDGGGPICTDRPTKSSGPCTVDKGHFQYEAEIFNASLMHAGGVTTDVYSALNPTLKYGVAPSIDLEADMAVVQVLRTRAKGGPALTVAGPGDLFLKVKYQFLGSGEDAWQAALFPYVKAPTARSALGNGSVEAGVVVPVSWKLSDVFTLTFNPELDALKDADGSGRHLNMVQLASVAASISKKWTLYGEIWGDWEFDPLGTTKQYSADTAVSYLVTSKLQLDGGLNFGLNRETPAVQAYVGLSQKF